MRFIYSVFLYVLSPFVVLKLFLNSFSNDEYRKRIGERFGNISFKQNSQPVIWLHAVSVGETQAAKPLVDRLIKQYADYRLVITTITPTGAVTVKQLFGESVEHFYLPYDLPHAVNKFISTIRPELLIVMETEIWPNLLYCCRTHGTHTALINARISDKSYSGYKKLAGLTRLALDKFDLLIAQTDKDAERLVQLGAKKELTRVSPNLKFDINIASSIYEQGQAMRRFLSVDRPVFIAASTHEGEEEIIFAVYKEVVKQVPDCLLILAPRHPDRVGMIKEIALDSGLSVVLRSEHDSYHSGAQVFLIDSLGELSLFYACADVAFVGGSLVPIGGHNVLEPASVGLPVITGRHIANFQEIIEKLQQNNAVVMVNGLNELVSTVLEFLADANKRHDYGERAKQVVLDNQGGVREVMELLEKFLVL